MRRAVAVAIVAIVACGGPQRDEPARRASDVDDQAQRLARAASTQDVATIRKLLGNSVMNGGLWFPDQACAAQFAAGGEVAGTNLDVFAACLAKLDLRPSARLDALPDVAVLAYDPGLEVEARFIEAGSSRRISWIGYSARLDGDVWPSVTADALEALRTAGDRDGPIDPSSLAPKLAPRAWLKVCVDATGTVSEASVRETTSTPGARAFVAAARAWHFKPFVLADQPTPVCAMFSMKFPPVHTGSKRERLPLPMPMKHDQVLVPQDELKRIAGDPLIAPDDETKVTLQQLGLSRLVGSFKLCLDETGRPTEVVILSTTHSLRYDQKIVRTVKTWAYTPFVLDGKVVPVCTGLTFIYNQH